MRLLQLSDTHLSRERAYFVPNFDAVLGTMPISGHDLVVITGDLSFDDPDDASDAEFARSRVDRISGSWRALPGNHDVGDTLPEPWMNQPITPERRAGWLARWGPDWWLEEAEGWVLLGLNCLLFGSGMAAEAEQWEWLSGAAAASAGRPVMLFLHKPLCLHHLGETEVTQKTVTPESRRLLREALGPARVRIVGSGHIHEYRTRAIDDTTMIWAPSTAYVNWLGRRSQFGARKVVGAVEYQFEGRNVTWNLVQYDRMLTHDGIKILGGARSLRHTPAMRIQ